MDYKQYVKDMVSRPITKELSFPEAEYRLRIDKVREVMDEKNLDVLLVTFPPNMSYLSGYQSFGTGWASCMVLPREGEPILHMHGLEVGPAMLTSWVKDIRGARWGYSGEFAGEIVDILKERSLDRKRIGVEKMKAGLSVDVYEALKGALTEATLIDASDVVAQPRMVKSPAELSYMRKAAEITLKAYTAALPIIKAGVTDNQVAAVMYYTLIREGSEFLSTQPQVSTGHRSGIAHSSFGRTPIQRGDTVVFELGASYH
ncbi:Xaa-Pro peptidase family protein, partial [Bradyrhizobium sp. RT9a]|uniref:M24 family metallopeptidase n=1 Tax=Bradyrhizobium sp. RT9a TaxID=3156384 RepID=UPI0033996AB3